jgi:hypothetical protein
MRQPAPSRARWLGLLILLGSLCSSLCFRNDADDDDHDGCDDRFRILASLLFSSLPFWLHYHYCIPILNEKRICD